MAFTALEIKIKAEVKDLKKGLAQSRKEVNKLKTDLEKISSPLEKMGKAFTDNSKLATKLKNIGASRIKISENNLALSLKQIKAQEKMLQVTGKLDDKTRKGLEKRASLLTEISAKEIKGIKASEKAARDNLKAKSMATKEAERMAVANKKALEIENNLVVLADKNRVLALKKANIGATAVEKVKNQLKFDLKSLDLQREKLKVAKRLNRDVVAGLNKQKSLLSEMASKKIQVLDSKNINKSVGVLGKLKDAFGKISVSVIAFNQALELLAKAVRAFRFVFNATIQPFADFETALIGVSKTTGLSGQGLEIFGRQIQELSGLIPASNEELLKVAETAGQLGVDGRTNLLNFADTMTRVAVSTNLTAEQAATDFTKILNVTRTSIDKIDEFSSVIVALGNNFATNEQKITRMANEVARATTAFDVAAEDTAAFATAMSSMGIRAEIGGSVLARSMVRIEESIISGGAKFEQLQIIMGQTGDQIKKTFSTDATKATRQFLSGLDAMRKGGTPVIDALDKFGLKGDEVNKVIPPLVKNVDELNRSFSLVRGEFGNATALMKESGKQFNTLNSRMKVMSNVFETLGTEIGRIFAPAVTVLIDAIIGMAKAATIAVRLISNLFSLFKLMLSDLKIFTPILALVGVTFLVVAGKASVLTASLGFTVTALNAAAAAMYRFVAATAPFILAGLGIVTILVTVAATIEILLLNFQKLSVLGEFVSSIFKQVVKFAQVGMLELGLAINEGLLAIAKGIGNESLTKRFSARVTDKQDEINKKLAETNVLVAESDKLSEQLDFGVSSKIVDLISDMSKDLGDFPDLFKNIDRSGEKVARIYEQQAASLKDQSKTLSKLAKILKENRKLQFEINQLRGGGTDPIIEQLRLDLSNVEARKQMVIMQGKLNNKLGDQSKIVKALTDQQDLLKERAAAALDAAIPDRILKRLSVDVVFGSVDGFMQGLEQSFAVFDEATAGFFTVVPRALIEGATQAAQALGDHLEGPFESLMGSISKVLTPIADTISSAFSGAIDAFDEFFGVDLGKFFSDAMDIVTSAFDSSVKFFEDLFPDDKLTKETQKGIDGAELAGQALGPGADVVKDIQPQLTADQNLSLAASELSLAAASLEQAASAAASAAAAAPPPAAGAPPPAAGAAGAIAGGAAAAGGDAAGAAPGAAPGALAASGAAGEAAGAAAGGGGMAAFEGMIDAIQGLIDFLPRILDKIAGIFTSLTELPGKILEGVTKVFDAAIKFVTDFIPNLIKAIQGIFSEVARFLKNLPIAFLELLQMLPQVFIEFFEELPAIIQKVVEGFVAVLPLIALAFIEFVISGLPKIIAAFIKMIPRIVDAIINGLIEGVKMIAKQIGNLLSGKGLDFGELENAGREAVENVARAITGVGTQLFQVAELGSIEKAEKAAKATGEAIRKAGSDVMKWLKKLWLWIFGMLSKLWEGLKQIWAAVWAMAEKVWSMLEQIWKNVWNAFNKAINDLLVAFSKAIGDIINAVGKAAMDVWNAFTKALGDIVRYFTQDLPNDILKAFDFLWDLFSLDTIMAAFKPVLDLFSVDKLKGIFTSVFDSLNPANLLQKMFTLTGGTGNKGTIEKLIGIDMPFVSFAEGGKVPGSASVPGDSLVNDKVPALLSPEEFVLPRSITQDPQSMALINALMKGNGVRMMATGGLLGEIEKVGKEAVSGTTSFLEDPVGGIEDLINAGGESLKAGLQSAFESIGIQLEDPMSLVRTAFKKMSGKMIGQTLGRQGLQDGGVISGFGGGDRLPFNLESGEGVLNKQAVKRMGVGAINRLNQGGAPGETIVNVDMTVNTTQSIDTAFIKNRIMPVMRDELKRSSVDGSFVMSKKGLR